MGNKVNPKQSRLGISVDQKYQLRDPLVVHILVLKTIKNMSLQYSAPYVTYTIRRNDLYREVPNTNRMLKVKNNTLLKSLTSTRFNPCTKGVNASVLKKLNINAIK